MRVRITAFALAAHLAALPAYAEPCAKTPEWTALNMAGLKSQMMVVALTCDLRDKYNGVVQRFRPELATAEKGLRGYFVRAFGKRAQTTQDDYVTQLANSQSELGIKQGTLFCKQNAGLFDEILKLPPAAPLAAYASSKAYVQPIAVSSCEAPKPVVTAAAIPAATTPAATSSSATTKVATTKAAAAPVSATPVSATPLAAKPR